MSASRATGWRVAVGAVAGLNAVAALGGAVGLVTGTLSLEELTDRLPFGSAVLGGIALGLLVAVPQAVLTVLAARRSTGTAAASVLVGSAMVGWILVETAFLRTVSPLQVGYVVVGLVQVALGFALGRRDPGVTPRVLAGMVRSTVRVRARAAVVQDRLRAH